MSIPNIGKADGKNIYIDIARLMKTRLLVTANSGAGKSWLLRRIFEQTFGSIQQIIIDPEGEFHTLREKNDYIICAPADADVVATPATARLLATRLLETQVSAVIDIFDLNPRDRQRFVKLFCDALVNAPKKLWHPVLVGLDEAHDYCPEKTQAESAGSVIAVGTRGRKRGFCLLAATQRLAKLNKDLAAEMNNKLVGRTILDVDVKRAAEELGFTDREQRQSLRHLGEGEFYCYGPALINDVTRVKVGGVKTTHPDPNQQIIAEPPPPTARIKKILAELQDLPTEAQKELTTASELRQEVTRLRSELTRARKAGGADPAEVREQVQAAVEKERQTILTALGKELQRHARLLQQDAAGIRKHLESLLQTADNYPLPEQLAPAQSKAGTGKLGQFAAHRGSGSHRQPLPPSRPPASSAAAPPADSNISSSQQRILTRLGELEAADVLTPLKATLAGFCRFSPKSGGYGNNLGKLRTMGYVDYPAPGRISLTDAGRTLVQASEPMNLEEYHECWQDMVSNSQARILEEVIAIYPDSISKHALAERLGCSPTSGGYGNNLGKLRTLGAIDYPQSGYVKATEVLFPYE